jgi:uncharacterized coiled-coil protein SlyX
MSNRAASQRSRDKKRRTIETLSERVAELEARNAELVQHLQLLQNHIQVHLDILSSNYDFCIC